MCSKSAFYDVTNIFIEENTLYYNTFFWYCATVHSQMFIQYMTIWRNCLKKYVQIYLKSIIHAAEQYKYIHRCILIYIKKTCKPLKVKK